MKRAHLLRGPSYTDRQHDAHSGRIRVALSAVRNLADNSLAERVVGWLDHPDHQVSGAAAKALEGLHDGSSTTEASLLRQLATRMGPRMVGDDATVAKHLCEALLGWMHPTHY